MTIEEKCEAIKAGVMAEIAADQETVDRLFGKDAAVTFIVEPLASGRVIASLSIIGDVDKILASVQDTR